MLVGASVVVAGVPVSAAGVVVSVCGLSGMTSGPLLPQAASRQDRKASRAMRLTILEVYLRTRVTVAVPGAATAKG